MAMRRKDYEDLLTAAFGSGHGITFDMQARGSGHQKLVLTDGKRRGQVFLATSPKRSGATRKNMVMELRHCWRDARPIGQEDRR